MMTALPVIDLPANAITPAGRFISERCLGHDLKALSSSDFAVFWQCYVMLDSRTKTSIRVKSPIQELSIYVHL